MSYDYGSVYDSSAHAILSMHTCIFHYQHGGFRMKQFFHYFFGAGAEVEFKNFTFAHFAPILVAAAIVYLLFRYKDKIAGYKNESTIRLALGMTMIICEMSYFWRLVGITDLNPNPVDHLPITICGWAIIFGSYLVVSKSQSLFDIVYFWVFAGTIFALITPTVITFTGPTRYRYYQFWCEHLLGYIAVFYMIFVHKMRPTVRSAVRSYCTMAVLAVIAITANNLIGPGANYLFMAKPESTPSILDFLPPNFALRIFIMAIVVTTLFFLSYLPWLLMDKKKATVQKAPAKEEATV